MYTVVHDSHVIVDLNLREHGHVLRLQTECDVAAAITAATLHALPFLDSGHHDVDQLAEEVVHILSPQLRLDRNGVSARSDTPGCNTALRLEGLHADVRNGLNSHTGNVQPARVFRCSFLDVAVDRDPLHLGDVVEADGLSQQSQDITSTGSTEGSVLVVGRRFIPRAETISWWRRLKAGRVVNIAQGEDIRSDGGLVSLLHARQRKRTWNENSR